MIVEAEESGCSVGVDGIQIEDGSQRQRVVTPPHVYYREEWKGVKEKGKGTFERGVENRAHWRTSEGGLIGTVPSKKRTGWKYLKSPSCLCPVGR